MLSREILEADHVAVVAYGREWIRIRLGLLPEPILVWAVRSDGGFTAHASHLVRQPDTSVKPLPAGSFNNETDAAVSAIRHLAAEFDHAMTDAAGDEPSFVPHEEAPDWIPAASPHPPQQTAPAMDSFMQFDFAEGSDEVTADQVGLDKFLAVMSTRNEVLLQISTLFADTREFNDDYHLFFIMGCIARTMQLLDGFVEAMKRKQLFVVGSLLRLNLDTYLRLMAKDLVVDKEKFFRRVLNGEQINSMRNRLNQKLTDAVLAEEAGKKDPWIPRVYKRTSGYIHLSATHCHGVVVQRKEDDGLHVSFQVGPRSDFIPLEIWFEMARGFDHVLVLILAELQRMGIEERRKNMGPDAVLTTRTRATEILRASQETKSPPPTSPIHRPAEVVTLTGEELKNSN